MKPTKTPIPEQDPKKRITNFNEVSLGYTEEQAKEEALRCLGCKHRPCVDGCPVQVPIPEFIIQVAAGDFEGAYHTIVSENRLPAVCGRVCPQETQCEAKCVRGIKGEAVAIGRLERFVADWALEHGISDTSRKKDNGIRVAVVGAGPAGLTCAGELARNGFAVTLFEALHAPGGVLMYGIPEFRLPKALVQREINAIRDLGVKIEKNVIVGRSITVEEIIKEEGFKAVFIGAGAGLPNFMRIPGENLNGVYSANEFLTRSNLMGAYNPDSPTPLKVGNSVAVVGGGNVAMDAARTARRLGAEKVYIIYRRSEQELPARLEEVHHAKEEGIEFRLLTNPIRIIGEEGSVTGIECISMELGEPDDSGRRRPIAIPNSASIMAMETVIIAIGNSPNPLIRQTTPDLETEAWGGIVVEESSMASSKKGVFAGGDIVRGAATVILAMGDGKQAAAAIKKSLLPSNEE